MSAHVSSEAAVFAEVQEPLASEMASQMVGFCLPCGSEVFLSHNDSVFTFVCHLIPVPLSLKWFILLRACS